MERSRRQEQRLLDRRSRTKRRRRRSVFLLFVVLVGVALYGATRSNPLAGVSPFRAGIVELAESQLHYQSDPADTYCNKFSAYWVSGTADCGNSNYDEEWCADFAAWVWQKAGALVDYQFINGDLNSSSASFYEWGVAHHTWHPVGSGYVPRPGDVAVYGLNASTLVAQHVAIVTSFERGQRGPDVINGDGDHTAHSIVEAGTDQFNADISGPKVPLSGYVSPTPRV